VEPPPFFGETEAELRAGAAAGLEEFFGDATQSMPLTASRCPTSIATEPRRGSSAIPCRRTTATGYRPRRRPRPSRTAPNVIVKPLSPGQHRVVIHLEAPAIGGTTDVI
jgi:hypothetical protein